MNKQNKVVNEENKLSCEDCQTPDKANCYYYKEKLRIDVMSCPNFVISELEWNL